MSLVCVMMNTSHIKALSNKERSRHHERKKTGAKSIKAILGNLKAIAQGVAELRNLYGSGHGKSSSYKGLESRHASLAIGSSTTLVRFLWDSYERHHNNEVN